MKKISLAAAAVAGALLLAGCQSSASRMYECEASGVSRDACYVAEQNRKSGINAAAEKQAMENANDLYGAKGTETNKAKHHHKRSYQEDEDATDYDDQDVDTGVVYRHGKKGYLNADGEFQQYAQSAHRHSKYDTSCKDLKLFLEQGVELTPPQQQQLSKCNLSAHVEKGHTHYGKTWKGYGVTVRQDADGLVYVNDHAAALDETTDSAKVYSEGLNQVVIYSKGRVTLLVNKVYKGDLK